MIETTPNTAPTAQTATTEQTAAAKPSALSASVQQSLHQYFTQLDGEEPANLYSMVLSEIEVPLLKIVMNYTNGNQSRAAILLGISRGTLRKKLAIYNLD